MHVIILGIIIDLCVNYLFKKLIKNYLISCKKHSLYNVFIVMMCNVMWNASLTFDELKLIFKQKTVLNT
jgi:hypothetical protein